MLKYAVDAKGKLLCADDPNAPQNGWCPLCGAPVFRKRSPRGNLYYSLYAREVHKNDACRTLDTSVNIMDILSTNAESFWRHYWGNRKLTPDGPDTKGPVIPDDLDAGDGPANPDNPDDPSGLSNSGEPDDPDDFVDDGDPFIHRKVTGPAEEKNRGIYTLQQLAATGHLDCADCEIEDSRQLSDITINPRFAYLLLELQNINKRVLQGKPQMCMDQAQTIRFKVYIYRDRYNRVIRRFKLADVHFPDKAVYNKIRNMLFEERADDTGKQHLHRRYERVAIVGNWTCIHKGACKCNWRCESADWICEGQLYTEVPKANFILPLPQKSENPKK